MIISPFRFAYAIGFLCMPLLMLCMFSESVLADDCNPNFGDKLYEWVEKDSRRQALELAKRDFVSRATNARIVEYDDLRGETESVTEFFNRYVEELQNESRLLGDNPPDLAQAVIIQNKSSEALNRLAEAGSKLDSIKQRLAVLAEQPNKERFVAEGAHHIGRSTLLESITPLGRSDAFDLNARYSIHVQVAFSSDGQVNGGSVEADGNEYTQAADYTAMTILQTSADPYSKAVAAIYLLIRYAVWSNEIRECNKKIAAQKAKVTSAIKLLAQRLPTGATTFPLYADEQRRAQARFAPVQTQIEQSYAILQERWRGLMASNLVRANLAANTLTSEKLKVLRMAHNTRDPLARLFDNLALTNLVTEVDRLQSFIIDREVQVAKACKNTMGLQAAEDLLDAKLVASSALSQLERIGLLAPILPTIELVRRRIERPAPSADEILRMGRRVPCEQAMASGNSTNTNTTLSLGHTRTLSRIGSRGTLQVHKMSVEEMSLRRRQETFLHLIHPLVPGGTLCTIYRNGMSYECRRDQGSGQPISNELGNGQNPRYSDVSRGSKDGGFSADSAKASSTVQEAKNNIEDRIIDLGNRQNRIEEAVPRWLSSTQEWLTTAVKQQRSELTSEKTFVSQFIALQKGALKDQLDTLVKGSSDTSTLAFLVKASGVVDTSLTDVPTGALLPDVPPVTGILPALNRYPANASIVEQRIIRESAKSSTLQAPESRTMHQRLLKAAERLAQERTQVGDRLAEVLIQDAAGLRFGDNDQGTISVISDDGIVAHVPYSIGEIPVNSVIRRVETFEYRSETIDKQIAIAHQALASDAKDRDTRLRVLKTSEELVAKARTEFYAGVFPVGEGLLEMAGIVADLVTAWTPGISWGRDIYESISGKDLISGRKLANWERGAAILGATTLGVVSVGSHVLQGLRSLEKIGLEVKRAEHIVDIARRLDSQAAKPGLHAIEEMLKRGIEIDHVEAVLDTGKRFYDVRNKSVLCIELEKEVLPGAQRVLVAVDPDAMYDANHMLIRTVHFVDKSDSELVRTSRYISLPDP